MVYQCFLLCVDLIHLCISSLGLGLSLALHSSLGLARNCRVLCPDELSLFCGYFRCIIAFELLVILHSFYLFSCIFERFLLCSFLVSSLLNSCSSPLNRIYKRKLSPFLMLLIHYYKCVSKFSIPFLTVIIFHLFFLILLRIFFQYLCF